MTTMTIMTDMTVITIMKNQKSIALLLLIASICFFVMGMLYPIMRTGYAIGPIRFNQQAIYLLSSFRYFFNKGEYFIGILLLFFTVIFPILKYIFLLMTLLGYSFPRHHFIGTALEVINKWAMLDVFVVAVLIVNLKFDSSIIITRLDHGTWLFALSVLFLMSCSLITRRWTMDNRP